MTDDEMVETLEAVRRRLNTVLYPGVQVSLIDVARVIAAIKSRASERPGIIVSGHENISQVIEAIRLAGYSVAPLLSPPEGV
jgi:DNA-binding NtrC family response regulator